MAMMIVGAFTGSGIRSLPVRAALRDYSSSTNRSCKNEAIDLDQTENHNNDEENSLSSELSLKHLLLEYNPFSNREVYNRSNLQPVLKVPVSHDATFVRACIVRDTKGTRRLCPRYIFSFQSGKHAIAMIALKQAGNMRSNYHIFDVSRGGNMKLTKKGGNYIGKLRRDVGQSGESSRTYSLHNVSTSKEQVAAFVFQRKSLVNKWATGSPPRKFCAIIPNIDENGESEPVRCILGPAMMIFDCDSTVSIQQYGEACRKMITLSSREPRLESGKYKLNFKGRVTVPSVKNMQIENSEGCLVMQFGRIAKDKFSLDYRCG